MQQGNVRAVDVSAQIVQMGAAKKQVRRAQDDSFRNAMAKAVNDHQKPEQPRRKAEVKSEKVQTAEEPQNPDKEIVSAKPESEPDDAQMAALVAQLASAKVAVVPVHTPHFGQGNRQTQAAGAQIQTGQMVGETQTQQPVMQEQGTRQTAEKPEVLNMAAQADQKTGNQGKTPANLSGETAKTNAEAEAKTQGAGKQQAEIKPQAAEGQGRSAENRSAQADARAGAKAESAKPQEGAKETSKELPAQAKPETAGNTEKVFVKVGENGNVDHKHFTQNISQKLSNGIAEGRRQFEIEMVPHQLGKISIKIIVEGGKADIILQCMNPKTQQLVAMNSEAIRTIVENGTGLTATVSGKEEAEQQALDQDGRNEQNKHGDQGKEKHEWSDAKAEIFLSQLRMGFAEPAQI